MTTLLGHDHPDHWHGQILLSGHSHAHFHPIGLASHYPVMPDEEHKHFHSHKESEPVPVVAAALVMVGGQP